ncbi:hypothetical protein [Streptomyces sp. NPDC058297]|uniref:hypothetical protein n=1 Tax=Streptomyces sp. NPDC058297 TaxID=3346433 RepID=UPI0036EDE387
MVVGEENKCGRGEKSSFTLNDTSTPTERGADAIQVGANPADLTVDEKANRLYVVANRMPEPSRADGQEAGPPRLHDRQGRRADHRAAQAVADVATVEAVCGGAEQ